MSSIDKIFNNLEQPLDSEVQKEYFIQLKNGDLFKRNTLIEHNLRLIPLVLNTRFYSLYKHWNELFEVGCEVLIKAVDSYDVSKKTAFSTYAVNKLYYTLLNYYNRKIKPFEMNKSLDELFYDGNLENYCLYDLISQDDDNLTKNIKFLDFYIKDLSTTEKRVLYFLLRSTNKKEDIKVFAKKMKTTPDKIESIYENVLVKIRTKMLLESDKNNPVNYANQGFPYTETESIICGIINSKDLNYKPNTQTQNLFDALYREIETLDSNGQAMIKTFIQSKTNRLLAINYLAQTYNIRKKSTGEIINRYLTLLKERLKPLLLNPNYDLSCHELLFTALKTKSKISRACNFFRTQNSTDSYIPENKAPEYTKYLALLSEQEKLAIEHYFGINGKKILDMEQFQKEFSLNLDEVFKLIQTALLKIGNLLEEESENLEKTSTPYKRLQEILKSSNYNDINDFWNQLHYLIFLIKDKNYYYTWERHLNLNGNTNNLSIEVSKRMKFIEKINSSLALISSINKYKIPTREEKNDFIKYLFCAIGGYPNAEEWVFKSSLKVLYQKDYLLDTFYSTLLRIKPNHLALFQKAYGLYSDLSEFYIRINKYSNLAASELFAETQTESTEKDNYRKKVEHSIELLKNASSLKIGEKKAFRITPTGLEKNLSSPIIDSVYPILQAIIDELSLLEKKIIILAFGFNDEHAYQIINIKDALNINEYSFINSYYDLLFNISNRIKEHKSVISKKCKLLEIIYSLYKEYPRSEIEDAILSLDTDDLTLLDAVLNKENEKEFHNYLDYFLSKIDVILASKLRDRDHLKELYKQFPFYPKILVKLVYDNLNKEYQEYLQLYMSSNIVMPFKKWKTKKASLYKHIIYKSMLYRLRTLNSLFGKTAYQVLEEKSETRILVALKKLSKEDKVLFHNFFPTLNTPLNTNNYQLLYKLTFTVLPKITTRLNKHSIKSIYELLSEFTKKEIDEEIAKLDDNKKHVIYLKYGSDLENPEQSPEWDNQKYRVKFNSIIKQIRKNLFKKHKPIKQNTIYNLLSEFTKEEIDEEITKLRDNEKYIIHLKYGCDLENPKQSPEWEYKKYYSKFNAINNKLRRRLTKKHKPLKQYSIYNSLNEFTKEEIDQEIAKLADEEKHTLYLKYGSNLENPKQSPEWDSQKYKIKLNTIIKRIRRNLTRKRSLLEEGSIYKLLCEFEKDSIDAVIETLSDEEKYLLYLRYGDDLENPQISNLWNIDYHKAFNKLITKMKKLLVKQKDASGKTITLKKVN